MLNKPFDDIQASDIQQLAADGVEEGRTLEFKRELPGRTGSDRKEFLADVSSFANALGGDLLFGVEEKDGRAVAANGLRIENVEAEILRLDEIIRSGISPRIIGCRVKAIPGLPIGPGIVVRVPRSWQGPHIVSFEKDFRFYSRTAFGKYRMDVTDVRDAVLRTASIEERIAAFRADRLRSILTGATPVPLEVAGVPLITIHVLPFQAFAARNEVDLSTAAADTTLMQPFAYIRGWSAPLFNIDGVYTYSGDAERRTAFSYVQLFRVGVVEAVDSVMLAPKVPSQGARLPSVRFPEHLSAFTKRIVSLYKRIDVDPPFSVSVSIVRATRVRLGVDEEIDQEFDMRPLDRHTIHLPEIAFMEFPEDLILSFKPMLDALWQACGAPRCLHFDVRGNWNPRHS